MNTVHRTPTKLTRRQHDRASVALPATVTFEGQDHGAIVLNIATGGAMIQCSASFPPATSFLLRCGSIAADAIVVWEKSGSYGLNFRIPVSQRQVTEQLSRNDAIMSRRLFKNGSDAARENLATKPALQLYSSARASASATHLSAIETSHQQVKSCMVALETIMASKLSDIGHFSTVRLQLRQANLTRTQVALEACRHLKKSHHAVQSLVELQRSELAVSQKISEHVKVWSMQSLQDDWGGYCRATRTILASVRDLIAAEKKVLCSVLQSGAYKQTLRLASLPAKPQVPSELCSPIPAAEMACVTK